MARLLSPVRIGPVAIANRVYFAPHATSMPRASIPNDAMIAYHEARAKGGTGMIVLEHTIVHPSGGTGGATLTAFDPAIVPAYRRLVDAVAPYGTKVFTQLGHLGGQYGKVGPRAPVVGASAVPTTRFVTEPRALRDDEVRDVIAGFALSARHCAEGGLTGIELSFAHNLLGGQFLSARLNRRGDGWSRGPAFLDAVIEAVREAAPQLALGVRLSADVEGSERYANALPGRVDFLSVTVGDASRYHGGTRVIPPPPIAPNVIGTLLEPYRVGVPLLATGRVVDAAGAEELVAGGGADMVGMARALIVDPDFVAKLREDRGDEVLRCIGCNVCATAFRPPLEGVRCVENPSTGRERTWIRPAPRAGRRVVVAGGGPAGMAAAAACAEAGDRVTLLEAGDRLGGQMALAAAAPGHAELAGALLANHRGRLARAGVEVVLGAKADVAALAAREPDRVIVATGAEPYAPAWTVPAARAGEVLRAWDVLAGARPAAERIFVVDWGGDPTGMVCADLLVAEGRAVTWVHGSADFGPSVAWFTRDIYLERLYGAGAEIVNHFELDDDGAGGAVLRNLYARQVTRELPRDAAVVLAVGRVPRRELADALRDAAIDVAEVGDCLSPRTLEEAVLEGTLAAFAEPTVR